MNNTPVQENITVPAGQTPPATVTQLVECARTLVSVVTGVNDCWAVLVSDRYHIVECRSRRVVTVTER